MGRTRVSDCRSRSLGRVGEREEGYEKDRGAAESLRPVGHERRDLKAVKDRRAVANTASTKRMKTESYTSFRKVMLTSRVLVVKARES